jgi:uncharacterized protein (DUF1330 family)
MAVYFIVRGNIVDPAMHDEYMAQAPGTLPAECKVLVLDFAPESVEGELDQTRTVVLEFPSRESFRAWYDSPEYQKLLPLRLGSVDGSGILVEGFVPPS